MSDHDKLREAIRSLLAPVGTMSFGAVAVSHSALKVVIEAAQTTLPKTKMVEVWLVHYAWKIDGHWHPRVGHRATQALATQYGDELCAEGDGETNKFIRVTGPHQQEVPA